MVETFFHELWRAVLAADDKDQFVNTMARSERFWGDIDGLSDNTKIEIRSYLSQLWDAAHMSIRDMCAKAEITQIAFSRYFDIPLRTVEAWCRGLRTPPSYDRLMMLRLLHLMPSFGDVNKALYKDEKPYAIPQKTLKDIQKRQSERKQIMKKTFTVKKEEHYKLTLCLADLAAAGYEVPIDAIEKAGLDISKMPSIQLIGKLDEDNYNCFEIYYCFEGYGVLYHAFGVPMDKAYTPEEFLMYWAPNVCNSHINWEELAAHI